MEVLPPRPSPPRTRRERTRELVARWRDWVAWFGVGRLLSIALSVLAVGAGGFWLLRTPPTPVDAALPRAGAVTGTTTTVVPSASSPGSSPASPGTTVAATSIVVHVAGAVVSPGVRTLPPGARVADAIDAAGGPAPDAALDSINLAQLLADGDRAYVPRIGDAPAVAPGVSGGGATSTEGTAQGPVDLNSATAEQLDGLPGVGPATAAAIVAHRDQNGPFASVDALADVRGIGPAKLEALRPLVTA